MTHASNKMKKETLSINNVSADCASSAWNMVEWNSLTWDVVVETCLCKDVHTAVTDFLFFGQLESDFVFSFPCEEQSLYVEATWHDSYPDSPPWSGRHVGWFKDAEGRESKMCAFLWDADEFISAIKQNVFHQQSWKKKRNKKYDWANGCCVDMSHCCCNLAS